MVVDSCENILVTGRLGRMAGGRVGVVAVLGKGKGDVLEQQYFDESFPYGERLSCIAANQSAVVVAVESKKRFATLPSRFLIVKYNRVSR